MAALLGEAGEQLNGTVSRNARTTFVELLDTSLLCSEKGGSNVAVVVITGCSSGFGLLAAVSFARRGDRVFATMRDLSRGRELEALARREGQTVDLVELDVNSPGSVEDGVGKIVDSTGRIDVLVNNAGVGLRAAVESFTDDQVRAVFDTNVLGPLRMIRAVLPGMRSQRSGVVVNVSSVSGRITQPFNGLYSASKHALEALSESLAFELAPWGVRVALIEPGYFRTPIGDKMGSAGGVPPDSPYAAEEHLSIERGRAGVEAGGDPQEVADLIVEAATTTESKLRWPIGQGVDLLLSARAAMSEPEWAAFVNQRFLGH